MIKKDRYSVKGNKRRGEVPAKRKDATKIGNAKASKKTGSANPSKRFAKYSKK